MRLKAAKVITAGAIFCDQIFTGLPSLPVLGQEIFGGHAGPFIGGGSGNTAAVLARLGLPVGCAARIGHDQFGTFLSAALAAEGVDPSYLQVRGRTNLTVALSYPTDRAFVTFQDENEDLPSLCAGLTPDRLAGVGHIHCCGHQFEPAWLKRVRAMGITVSLDIGWDPERRWDGLREVLPLIDVFLPNQLEASSVTGEADPERALSALRAVVPTVAIKMDAAGAIGIRDGAVETVPAFRADAVDPTGAGDAFDAGFLYGWLSGAVLWDCLLYGNACGARAVTCQGGTMNAPRLPELLEMCGQD